MPVDLLSRSKDLLSRELKLCRTLRTMISRELEAIVLDGDMDELLRILKKKDGVISQLQLLSDEWRRLLSDAGIQRANADGLGRDIIALFPEDRELSDLLQQTREVADSIIRAEDEAQTELEKHADGLRERIINRTHGQNVAASYAKMGGSII